MTLILLICFSYFPPNDFFVERISFKDLNRVNESILLAELKLEPGVAYSEKEIREAQSRLDRLPMIQKTGIRLTKGSERGKYVLEITIKEVRKHRLNILSTPITYLKNDPWEGDPQNPESSWGPPIPLPLYSVWVPVGKNGVFQYTAPAFFTYSHYNLWNGKAATHFNLVIPGILNSIQSPYLFENRVSQNSIELATVALQGVLDYHLVSDHWLSFLATYSFGPIDSIEPIGENEIILEETDYRYRNLQFAYRFDRLDHPVFTSSGSFLEMGVILEKQNQTSDLSLFDGLDSQSWVPAFEYKYFWEWDHRQSFSLLLGGKWPKSETFNLTNTGQKPLKIDHQFYSVSLQYSWQQFDMPFLWKARDVRFELSGSYFNRDSDLKTVIPDLKDDGWSLTAKLISRDDFLNLSFSLEVSSSPQEIWP